MNRIICDICGSEYPETADRCPICSYARQGTEKIVASAPEAVRAKVKGGRFSTKNVKKRRKAQGRAEQPERDPNRPLVIVIVVLLIAILLMSVYIGVRFLRGTGKLEKPTAAPSTTAAPAETTQPPVIPCRELVLDMTVMDFELLGEEKQLSVKAVPADTTDVLSYASADECVVKVSETGILTAAGPGQTTVTITCGAVSKTCTVVCWFREETTAPAETTLPTETTAATKPTEETKPPKLELTPFDASCFALNEVFELSVSFGGKTITRSKVTWSTSDPAVATVENGTVTAVGKGTATITAEYEGKTATCVVRCRFADTTWRTSASDVTLTVGQSFKLSVMNNSGETASVQWTMNKDGIVSVDGNTVTALEKGTVTLSTTVDGVALSCIVRVK